MGFNSAFKGLRGQCVRSERCLFYETNTWCLSGGAEGNQKEKKNPFGQCSVLNEIRKLDLTNKKNLQSLSQLVRYICNEM